MTGTDTYSVFGEYFIRYRYDTEEGRTVVTDILGYVDRDGQPIEREDLEKDFLVMSKQHLQEEIDLEQSLIE
jgi:hypothetical protein